MQHGFRRPSTVRESEKFEMAKPSLPAGFTDPFALAVDYRK
jgi:hypothetical protein